MSRELTFTVKVFDDEEGNDLTISLDNPEEEVEEAAKEAEEEGSEEV